MRLLITGFGPFPGFPKNPSMALARTLVADLRLKRAGIQASICLLPTIYAGLGDLIARNVDETRPQAVLMLGVASRRRHLSVEVRAVNRASRLHPDAAGQLPTEGRLAIAGVACRAGRAPFAQIVAAGNAAGIRTKISRNAGAYLCNASYWHMLGTLPADTPCFFLHIPKIRSISGGRNLVNATRAAALLLARRRS